MTKKVPVKLKVSASKPSKASQLRTKSPALKKDVLPVADTHARLARNAADEGLYKQTVHSYEQALKALQTQKFDRAKVLLEKVIAGGPRELVDRATMHLNICNQQLGRVSTSFKTPEEHYDYAVSLMNMGDYVTAREHLEKLMRDHRSLDFVWYGLAILECQTGHSPEALNYLAEAIRLNKNNRFQARNDSDFRNLADDPRFTELLYPENGSTF